MKFSYTVFDQKNKLQKGTVDAENLKAATKLLVGKGWYIKKITPKGGVHKATFEFQFGGVSLMDKVLLAKHLSTMLASGISLSEALDVIAGQTNSPRLKKIVQSLIDKIHAGQSLSKALSAYPKVFDPFFINILKVGEESGTLEENLKYLAEELEDQLDLKRAIKAAAFYPTIILVATFGLGLVLAYFVLPKIKSLFSTLSFDLPLSTKILLFIADFLDQYGLHFILTLLVLVILGRIFVRLKVIKPYWHQFLLKLPVIGQTMIEYNLIIMARTLGTLLKSGLTIDQSMMVTRDVLNNIVYQKKINQALEEVKTGKQFSDVLAGLKQSKRKPIFPLLTIKMISVGEKTGKLDESFIYLAAYFEKEVDNRTKNLTTTLEPLLLVFVGLIVGFVAISVIAPIYQITGRFQS